MINSMIIPLKKVLVCRPDAFISEDVSKWNYQSNVNISMAQEEHDKFCAQMEEEGIEVLYQKEIHPKSSDSIFVHDSVLITHKGAIVLNMGKELRKNEPEYMKKTLGEINVNIIGEIRDPGTLEGGDCLWLDPETLIVGKGSRTNNDGITQLKKILAPLGISVLSFDLPLGEDPNACLHLQSLVSIVDLNVAVVYAPFLPYGFFELLKKRKYQLVCVSLEEFKTQGTNCLTLRPGKVLILRENHNTIRELETLGIECIKVEGREMCHKMEGGPTCLTRPLVRSS